MDKKFHYIKYYKKGLVFPKPILACGKRSKASMFRTTNKTHVTCKICKKRMR